MDNLLQMYYSNYIYICQNSTKLKKIYFKTIMTLVPSILALYFKIAYRFAIETPYIKLALKDIALGYIKYFIITGSIVLLLGIACICIYTYLSRKAQERRSPAA